MIGDTCTMCGAPILEGQHEERVPHRDRPDTSVHGICPTRRAGEESK